MFKYIVILIVLLSINIASAQTIIGDNIVTEGTINTNSVISNYSSSKMTDLISPDFSNDEKPHMTIEGIDSVLYPTTSILYTDQLKPYIPFSTIGFISLSYHGNTVIGVTKNNFLRDNSSGITIDDTQGGLNDFSRTLYGAGTPSSGINQVVQYAFNNTTQAWTNMLQGDDYYFWGIHNQSRDPGILHEFGWYYYPGIGYALDMEGHPIVNAYIPFYNITDVPCFTCSIPFNNITGFSDSDNYEPSIVLGQPYQVWIGNKTWQNISDILSISGTNGTNGSNLTMTNIVNNGNGTYTWFFSDGTVFTTSNLNGLQGIAGNSGSNGTNLTISSIINNGNGTYIWHFSDGTNFTTGNLNGSQGIQGIPGNVSNGTNAYVFCSINLSCSVNGSNTTIDYNRSDFANQTVQNNLDNWNNTYNKTYDQNLKNIVLFNATSMNVTAGILIYGDVNNLAVHDQNSTVIQEAASTNPLTFYINFTGANSLTGLQVVGRYDGGNNHYILVEVFNNKTFNWDIIGTFQSSTINTSVNYQLTDISSYEDGITHVRFEHTGGAGNTNHYLYLDQVVLTTTAYGRVDLSFIDAHITNYSNPHQTNMSQVGITDGMLSAWNSTFNGTYDSFLALINQLQLNDTNSSIDNDNQYQNISSLNSTIDHNLSNYTNSKNWVSNLSVDKNYSNLSNLPILLTNISIDRNLSNFTNNPNFVSNITIDRNLSNYTNSQSWVSNSTVDKDLFNFSNNNTNFLNTSNASATFEPKISTGNNNFFWNGTKVFVQILSSYISDFNVTVQGIINTNTAGFINNITSDKNVSNLTTGNLSISRLNGGIGANSTSFLRGDGIWATPTSSGSGAPTISTYNTIFNETASLPNSIECTGIRYMCYSDEFLDGVVVTKYTKIGIETINTSTTINSVWGSHNIANTTAVAGQDVMISLGNTMLPTNLSYNISNIVLFETNISFANRTITGLINTSVYVGAFNQSVLMYPSAGIPTGIFFVVNLSQTTTGFGAPQYNGTWWVKTCIGLSQCTVRNTTITPDTKYHNYAFTIGIPGTVVGNVTFWIDNVQVGTFNTNIPSLPVNYVPFIGTWMESRGGSAGIPSFDIDYWKLITKR